MVSARRIVNPAIAILRDRDGPPAATSSARSPRALDDLLFEATILAIPAEREVAEAHPLAN